MHMPPSPARPPQSAYLSWPPNSHPIPAELYVDLAANRPDAICVHAAACSRFQKVHWLSSPSSVGGIIEFMADEFRQRWHNNAKVGQLGAGGAAEQSEVWQPTTDLDSWLFPWSLSACPAGVF